MKLELSSTKSPISTDEVTKHNSENDCWIVINGQVYDLTSFMSIHPGGSDIIKLNAGKDVSAIFNPLHAPNAIERFLPPECYLGPLQGTMPKELICDPYTPGESKEDIASKQIVSQTKSHQGPKNQRVVWLGYSRIIATTGFSKSMDREIGIWDALDLKEGTINKFYKIDQSSGILMPFYDLTNRILYVVGKGDGNIRCFELKDRKLQQLSEFHSREPQRGFALLPHSCCDVKKSEITRCLKTVDDQRIIPISFHVPMRSEGLLDDEPEDVTSSVPMLIDEEASSTEEENDDEEDLNEISVEESSECQYVQDTSNANEASRKNSVTSLFSILSNPSTSQTRDGPNTQPKKKNRTKRSRKKSETSRYTQTEPEQTLTLLEPDPKQIIINLDGLLSSEHENVKAVKSINIGEKSTAVDEEIDEMTDSSETEILISIKVKKHGKTDRSRIQIEKLTSLIKNLQKGVDNLSRTSSKEDHRLLQLEHKLDTFINK